MLSINTNLSGLIAQNSLKSSSFAINQAIERMTTGYKINHASDNAANYSIATNMTTKIGAYMVAEDNALQGIEMMSSSLESLNHISDKLNRMRALAVQTQNGTYGGQSLNAINAEAKALLGEVTRINESATYNGIKLFNTGKMDVTNAGKELELNEQGFLQDVVKVDTTGMTALSSMDDEATLAVGEYTISTVEELVQLQEMANAGLITAGSTFVLTNNLDISAYCRSKEASGGWVPIVLPGSNFEGNGFAIKGLYINRASSDEQALFTRALDVNNLKLEDVDITGRNCVGAIAANGAEVNNCVVKGEIVAKKSVGGIVGGYNGGYAKYCYANVQIKGDSMVGGIFGHANYASVQYCISEGFVEGNSDIGGILGYGDRVTNSKSLITVKGETNVGGIIGRANGDCSSCYSAGSVYGDANVGGLVGIQTRAASSLKDSIIEGFINGSTNVGVLLGSSTATDTKILNCSYYAKNACVENLVSDTTNITLEGNVDITVPCDYTLQIASCGDDTRSTLSYTTYIDFGELNSVLSSGIENAETIEKIDELVNIVSLKQTELGTAINRLESVLDEISLQYENLVSSRSTILDTDISEVSSYFIRQQILQQASATLMATANQSPSIALQLI